MYSMTGYGKGIYSTCDRELLIELKTVNHRFLDINLRTPKALLCVEDTIRKVITDNVGRGRVEVYVSYVDKSEGAKKIAIDQALAKGYYEAANTIANLLKIENDIRTSHIIKINEVLKVESQEDDAEILAELVLNATTKAVLDLNKMREVEGEKLLLDIKNRFNALMAMANEIKALAPLVALSYKERIKERMAEMLQNVEVDEVRLLQEVAYFVDKSNIDEELTRLFSHFSQTDIILKGSEAVGRKLDFIIQEYNREVNTICSKANYSDITVIALNMKAEIEKIREQVQNLE